MLTLVVEILALYSTIAYKGINKRQLSTYISELIYVFIFLLSNMVYCSVLHIFDGDNSCIIECLRPITIRTICIVRWII